MQPAHAAPEHGTYVVPIIIPGCIAVDEDGCFLSEKQHASSTDELEVWLEDRLCADRFAILRQMESLQKDLVYDFQRRLGCHNASSRVSKSWPVSDCHGGFDESIDVEACSVVPTEIVVVTSSAREDTATSRENLTAAAVPGLASGREYKSQGCKSELSVEISSQTRFRSFIKSQTFELICVSIVLLNAFFMAAKIQYEGISNGHSLGVRAYDTSAEVRWPFAESVFPAMDKLFSSIFVCELILRLVAYRLEWLCSLWNYLDAVVVGIDLSSSLFTTSMPLNAYILRMARFGKLVRIVRVMRSNKLLESLKLLVASIQASYNTLCISLLVLLIIQSVAGMLLSQLVEPFIRDKSEPEELRREVFAHYGTFWRSMITMFEITFANWAPTCRLLIDNVSEWYGIFFLLYRCLVGFAMLSVIQAVFIQQTMKSAQLDDDYVIQQRQREKKALSDKLYRIFKQLDTSGDGHVSLTEFEALLTDPRMKLLMSTLEVDVRDLETLFKLLDDGDGQISPDEFIEGLQRMKGSAKALDLMALMKAVQRVEAKLENTTPRSNERPNELE